MTWYVGMYEKTGVMARPWVDAGYSAVCIDMDAEPGYRDGILYQRMDARYWAPDGIMGGEGVAFFAAFPPCDHLAVSGARWFKGKGLRKLASSIELFAVAAEWAERLGAPYLIENPVSTISTYWRKPDHTFHPWHYCGLCPDDAYTKKTCLWTGGGFVMPAPEHPDDVTPDDRIHKAPPSPERADMRSATPLGFARAVFNSNHNAHGIAA